MPGGRLVRMELLFCMSQSHAIRAKGYLFVRAWNPCRRGTAYVSRPKKRPAVWPRVPSFICFTVAHIAFELVLYRHKRAWKPALWSRVGTRRHGVSGAMYTDHDSNDSSQPARFSGRAAIFLSIYLRKRNTTVLSAAYRAVFCCLATSPATRSSGQSSGPGHGRAVPSGSPAAQWSRRSARRRRAG